jgi:hypothetical protein
VDGLLADQLKADQAACDAAVDELLLAHDTTTRALAEAGTPTADADGVIRMKLTVPVEDGQFLLLDPAAPNHIPDTACEAPWSDEAWERGIDVIADGLAIRAAGDWTDESRVTAEVWPTMPPIPPRPWKPTAEAGIEAHGARLTLVSLYGDPERDGTPIHLGRPGHYQCRVSVRGHGAGERYLLQLWLGEHKPPTAA